MASTISSNLISTPSLNKKLSSSSSFSFSWRISLTLSSSKRASSFVVLAMDAKPTVLVAEKLSAAGIELLKDFANVDCSYNLSPEELCTKISLCDALIVRSGTKVSREVFGSSGGRLKVVGRAGVGIDNLDLSAATKHGCLVDNAPTEANRLLAGEKGHVHLKNSQKMLRRRIQYMVAQVSDIYPVNTSTVKTHGEKLDSSSVGTRSGDPVGSKAVSPRSLTILGVQQISLPLKKAGFFSDKEEVQRSASALGYVSQAVSLIASYLDVPLRYPLHLGGSHSYITDYAPSIEPASTDSLSSQMFYTNLKSTEFPLFLEGQDTTRAAYAIFLLNKDLEPLMNFIGIQSLGPRHVLANLKELFRTIMSQEYIDT